MRRARLRLYGSALVSGALLVACADALGPSISAIDDLFSELDSNWTSSTNPVSVSPGVTHLTTRPAAAACDYSASSERFVCPSRTQNGLTASTSYQLLDAASTPQVSFDADAIAAVRLVADVTGALSSADGATITQVTAHSDRIVSGLTSGVHTLNATESSTFASTNGTAASTFSMVETTSDLVLATRYSAKPWPSSGSITTLIYAGLPGVGVPLSTVTSTFNGTQKVTLVISTGGLTQSCIIDLKGAAAICS